MTRHDRQRVEDVLAAVTAIHRHLAGDLDDGLIFDAVRAGLIEIGEAVKQLPSELLASEPDIPWQQTASMRNRLAHRYFDASHAILQAAVDHDLAELEQAALRLLESTDSH